MLRRCWKYTSRDSKLAKPRSKSRRRTGIPGKPKYLPHSRLVWEQEGKVQAWAALAPVSARDCYRGVAEVSIYVATGSFGQGIGSKLMARRYRRIRTQRHLEPLFIHLSRKPGDAQAAPASWIPGSRDSRAYRPARRPLAQYVNPGTAL